QLLVADNLEAVVAAREAFEELEGRVNVICSTGYQPVSSEDKEDHGLVAHATEYDWNQHPYRVRLAIDLVRFDAADAPIARHLLGKTVIVEDLATAAALH